MVNKIVFNSEICEPLDFSSKQKIINYLYNKLELYKYSYNILDNLAKVKYLECNEHYVTPNFKGINYLLLVANINNQNYCILIDKKTLSYNKLSIDIKNVNICKLKITLPESMYEGTIIDGKIINNKVFLIQECYFLMGENLLNKDLSKKFLQLNDLINNHFKNYLNNTITFKLNKLYRYNELKELISNLTNLTHNTNGLIFFPKTSGKTFVFLENKTEKINIISKSEEIIKAEPVYLSNNLDYLKTRKYSFEESTTFKILFLERTDILDVYNIYDESNLKLGIAGIPTLKISQMCDNIIKDDLIKFKCVFCKQFNKWIPLETM